MFNAAPSNKHARWSPISLKTQETPLFERSLAVNPSDSDCSKSTVGKPAEQPPITDPVAKLQRTLDEQMNVIHDQINGNHYLSGASTMSTSTERDNSTEEQTKVEWYTPTHVLPSPLGDDHYRLPEWKNIVEGFNETEDSLKEALLEFYKTQDNKGKRHGQLKSMKQLEDMYHDLKVGVSWFQEAFYKLKFRWDKHKHYRDRLIQTGAFAIMLGSYMVGMASDDPDDPWERAFTVNMGYLKDEEWYREVTEEYSKNLWRFKRMTKKDYAEYLKRTHDSSKQDNGPDGMIVEHPSQPSQEQANETGFAMLTEMANDEKDREFSIREGERAMDEYCQQFFDSDSWDEYLMGCYAFKNKQVEDFERMRLGVSDLEKFKEEMYRNFHVKYPLDYKNSCEWYTRYQAAPMPQPAPRASEGDIGPWENKLLTEIHRLLPYETTVDRNIWLMSWFATVQGRRDEFLRLMRSRTEWLQMERAYLDHYKELHNEHFCQMDNWIKHRYDEGKERSESEDALKHTFSEFLSTRQRRREANNLQRREEDSLKELSDIWRLSNYMRLTGRRDEFERIEKALFDYKRVIEEMNNEYHKMNLSHRVKADYILQEWWSMKTEKNDG